MKSYEIRDAFLNYFKDRGHTIVGSAPLVPKNDPSLLFVNAGMVQFKDTFLGKEKRDYVRATSCQKCVRAGGKHNDLENVGYTARHHTFFEMLGNFSFGDYFKSDAIHFGWEFITKILGIDKNKLWVTVFQDDDEAFNIWNKQECVPSSRIVRMGAKENFWSMGDTGPCGGCSEIHIDQGKGVGCGRSECSIECDCDRYLELWNLVFMQYNRDKDGNMSPLPKPSIDTGLGLERVAAVLQGVYSNFDTDLFEDIINDVSSYFSTKYGEDAKNDVGIRVISDHLRAADFLIADGVLPDKEGRGYVLRKIMRRAMRFGKQLGAKEPFLHKFVDSVNAKMGDVYPELIQNRDTIVNIVKNEENQFFETLEDGLKILNELFEKSSNKIIDGKQAFKLYDTYGFPVDLTLDIAKENGFSVEMDVFNEMLKKQRKMSKASWKGTDEVSISDTLASVYKTAGATAFAGYEKFEIKSKLAAIIDKNEKVVNRAGRGEYYCVFDKTPFYAESGGQVSDTGFIFDENSKAFVEDVQKYFDGNLFVHKVSVLEGEFEIGKEYNLRINIVKRKDVARHHTATHLLDAALKNVLGEHVRQAGSLVESSRLRFDFTHFSKLTTQELHSVEVMVNNWILEDYPVITEVMSIDEAMKTGAVALFDEKYSDIVRVVSVGGISKELCGGTHAKFSGEIGLFKVISESALSKGVRRIEAKVGIDAYEYVRKMENILREISNKLSVGVDDLADRIDELKNKENKSKSFAFVFNKDNVRKYRNCNIYADKLRGADAAQMRNAGDQVKAKMKSGVVIIFNIRDDKTDVIVMVTKDCIEQFKANDILHNILPHISGKGGGKAEFAQGGGHLIKIEKLDDIIDKIEKFI